MPEEVKLTVNGKREGIVTEGDRPLLDVLREDLGLTGTKYGCGEGECGACTVLMDGIPTRSCITTAAEAAGSDVQTIEALQVNGQLHPVQQAFVDQQAVQCGYCVPGHIMTAVALTQDNPDASRDDVVAAMSEHICRCCNYENLLAAVLQAVGR